MRSKAGWLGSVLVVTALGFALGGCAAQQAREMDSMLAAAGFQVRPANTPEKLAQLKTLQPRTLLMMTKANGGPYWVVADPTVCQCLYVGNEAAYQRYEQLKLRKEYADEQMMTAEMNEDAAMNWGMWGPWGPWGY
jgi:hypothetical protein